MASRIKGITIEINGDTTKLSQALRETDTQLTTVQKNLRDVERLLKLDPTNTELLAQKQRLLAEQSALAADRLAQMEDAANHLDSSLSQSQLDDFNLELDLTRARASLAEQELRDFEQRLNDVDDSAEDSSDSLNDVGDAADGMDDGFSLADGVISNFVGDSLRTRRGRPMRAFTRFSEIRGKPQRRPSFCPSLPQALRTWQSGSTLPQASMAPLENPSQLNR